MQPDSCNRFEKFHMKKDILKKKIDVALFVKITYNEYCNKNNLIIYLIRKSKAFDLAFFVPILRRNAGKEEYMKYKGYTVTQAPNNHIMICKDGKMVSHVNCPEKKTETELKEIVDFILKIRR